MPNRPIQSADRVESTGSTPRTALPRRRLLRGGGVAATVAVAGCLDSFDAASDDDSEGSDGDETDDDRDASNDEAVREEVIEVIDAYLEAAAAEDLETMSDLSHELNPLDPQAWVDDGWEFEGGAEEELPDEYDVDVRTADVSVDDVYALEGAEFWFEEVDLEAELEGESLAIAEIPNDTPRERTVWVFATEDDEWRLLLQVVETEEIDDPEEFFEEPIEDENDDVVVEINWEYDRADEFDMGDEDDDSEFDVEVTQAEVVLTDSPGIEAHTVRAESTIGGGSNAIYDPDREPGGWAGARIYVTYDPDGDQIVVTAVSDGGETIVHREHYTP